MKMAQSCRLNETVSFGSLSREFFYAEQLMDEVLAGNSEGVRRLLQGMGANPNTVVPEWGVAALHLMAGQEDEDFGLEVTEVALSVGGDPNVRSEEGLTPVHVAATWGRCRTLQTLLCAGGDPHLLDFRLELSPAQYALRYSQWQAYNIVTTYQVILEDQQRFEKYLCKDYPSSCAGEEVVVETNQPKLKPLCTCKDEIDYNRPKNIDLQLPKRTTGKLDKNRKQLFEDFLKTKEIIKRNLVMPKRKESCVSEDESEFERLKNADHKLPRGDKKKLPGRKQSEVYFCNFEEAVFESKQPTRRTQCPYEFSDSENHASESRRLVSPDNKMLCKMSRIFLFMLRKRRISQHEE